MNAPPLELDTLLDIERPDGSPSRETPTSALLEMIIRRPQEVTAGLTREVAAGADPEAVLALLDAAEGLSRIRGAKVAPFIAAMRQRLSLPVTAPP